ncbi:MAG: phosphatidylserine decarboxylase [Prevotella sp.]|nr:phosphatidylserine decarboxylase [Alistipes senegalensis]MCM1357050.1 phosphatidylserine decarboxylase [Prevotella sp.]MCM1472490.1 phosphatidylserine decarboxylase [Muribaculaceae bacterium]
MIKNRKGEIIATNQEQNRILTKLYDTLSGRILLKFLVVPFVSRTAGVFMDSPFSVPFIRKFIKKHKLDTSDYVMKGFNSYNEFFTRKIKPGKRIIDYHADHLISPCDSKLSVYRISCDSIFKIKNSLYRVSDLLANEFLSRRYEGGYCFIYRLEVDDYHRYCYIDDGSKTENVFIQGEFHTVNPIALRHYNIYKRNSREYTVLHTDNFGDVVHMEVGALMVGRICNHHGEHYFVKGEEKGLFKFGGSTIVQLFEKNTVRPDYDIIKNTREGFETIVHYGEKVGTAF